MPTIRHDHIHLGGYARITPSGHMDTISALTGASTRALLFESLSCRTEHTSGHNIAFWSSPSRVGDFNPAATAITSHYLPCSPSLLFGDVVVSRVSATGQSAPLNAAELEEVRRLYSAITKQNPSTSR